MTDYRVTVKVRNARLLRAIANAGYTSIPKFAEAAGVRYDSLNDLINMTSSPLTKGGDVGRVAASVIDFLCEPFESLFTQRQCDALATNKSERDVSAEQVFALLTGSAEDPLDLICADEGSARVDALLGELSGPQSMVIQDHFGMRGSDPMTLDQIAEKRGVSRERVRQIENKAMRILRGSVAAKAVGVDMLGRAP